MPVVMMNRTFEAAGQAGMANQVLSRAQVLCFLDALENEVLAYQVPVVDLIAVQTDDPYRVLVATVLSSRTKDEVTAGAAARLFERAPNPETLASLAVHDIAQLIYPVGFYQTKSRQLPALAAMLIARYDGAVPDTIEALLELPGVGRKTANLVLSTAFGKPAICVDTHVHRIMNIWGFVATGSPQETEMVLRRRLPKRYWSKVNRFLVAFGQKTCRPIGPRCDICLLATKCPRIGVQPRKIKREPMHGT
jgi:endonuclease III